MFHSTRRSMAHLQRGRAVAHEFSSRAASSHARSQPRTWPACSQRAYPPDRTTSPKSSKIGAARDLLVELAPLSMRPSHCSCDWRTLHAFDGTLHATGPLFMRLAHSSCLRRHSSCDWPTLHAFDCTLHATARLFMRLAHTSCDWPTLHAAGPHFMRLAPLFMQEGGSGGRYAPIYGRRLHEESRR
jgi:hypothetical protein